MGPFSSSQNKANDFILCGWTIKRPQDQSAIGYLTPSVSQIEPARFRKLKVTLCQHSQELKKSHSFFFVFFLSFKSDIVCVWLTLSLMKNRSVSHARSKLLTHYSQYCAREQSEMSAAHTVSFSEINVPLRKRHRHFHNRTALQSSAPCCFLGDTFALMLLHTYRIFGGAGVCFAGVFICLFVCLKRSVL